MENDEANTEHNSKRVAVVAMDAQRILWFCKVCFGNFGCVNEQKTRSIYR